MFHPADDKNSPSGPTLDLTTCPQCGATAEVTERAVLESTDGPVEHVRVVCVARHWFLLPAASLGSASAAARGSAGRTLRPIRGGSGRGHARLPVDQD